MIKICPHLNTDTGEQIDGFGLGSSLLMTLDSSLRMTKVCPHLNTDAGEQVDGFGLGSSLLIVVDARLVSAHDQSPASLRNQLLEDFGKML